MGPPATVLDRYARRYLPAQRLYRAEAQPELFADVLINNDDPARPCVTKWPSGCGARALDGLADLVGDGAGGVVEQHQPYQVHPRR
jgi:hypothetical protein